MNFIGAYPISINMKVTISNLFKRLLSNFGVGYHPILQSPFLADEFYAVDP